MPLRREGEAAKELSEETKRLNRQELKESKAQKQRL